MRTVVLLGLFVAGALCAPLAVQDGDVAANDDVIENDIRVKRAKEAIMFGNQQNENKEISKRGDLPELEDENTTDDKNSIVVVKEPVDIEETEDSESVEETPVIPEVASESTEDETEAVTDDVIDNTTGDEAEEVKPLEESAENTDLANVDEAIENMDYGKYIQALLGPTNKDMKQKQYMDLNRPSSGVQDFMPDSYKPRNPYIEYYNPYAQLRFRRSQNRRFVAGNYGRSSLHLKRGHRTKRDLYYPELPLTQQYMPYDDPYYNRPYGGDFPSDEDEVKYFMEELARMRGYDDIEDDEDVMGYDTPYMPYQEYEDEADEYLPEWYDAAPATKRQADLSYFPGIKRSLDFYPYFMEPDTHFKAFVPPQKRTLEDYADAYKRVMELAALLRESEK